MEQLFAKDLFKEKTYLVTGGATGIGFQISRDLVSLGAKVVIASRNMDNLEKAAKELGENALPFEVDIRDASAVGKLAEFIQEGVKGLDGLVNNAGGQFPCPAEKISPNGWKAVIETNLSGTFNVSQAMFNQFFKDNGGSIVNVIANMWQGFPMMAHTGAARAGVDNLTKTLCSEWGRYKVRINSVAPGIIQSSGLDTYEEPFKSFVKKAGKMNQVGRAGNVEEVSSAVLFLLSPGANFINGATLKVDGGESLFHPFYPPSA